MMPSSQEMTLLVHVFQYRLHHSEITNTDAKNNSQKSPIPTTDPIIGTSLILNNELMY